MPTRNIQVALDYGQLDQNLSARQDSKAYTNGLLDATNWRPLPQGGVSRRPGFFQETNGNTQTGKRLVDWEFDEDELYLVSIHNTELRFYRVSATTLAVSFVATVDISPYWTSISDQEIIELEVAQRYDTMILAHRNFQRLLIVRTGLSTFVVSLWNFSLRNDSVVPQSPTFRFTPGSITMQPCTVTGAGLNSVTEGQTCYMQWFGTDPSTGLAYNPDIIELNSIVRYNNIPFKVITEADVNDRIQVEALQDAPRTKRYTLTYSAGSSRANWLKYETVLCTEDAAEALIAGWQADTVDLIVIKGDITTVGAILVGAESQNTAEIAADQGLIEMAPTSWWEESVYSDYRGWFGAVAFYQQRLFVGGSWDQPAMVCASKLQQYSNFDMGNGEDVDAIQVIMSSDNPGQIRSFLPANHLQIFTTTCEQYIGETQDETITPRTISIKSGSRFGTGGQASPKVFGGEVFFSSRDNRQLRSNSWDDVARQYNSPPLGILHQDLLTDIKEIYPAYGHDGSPAEYVYVLNKDGTLIVIYSVQVQGVPTGFWKWTGTSAIQSVCTMRNELFLLIGNYIHRATFSQFCEVPSTLQTTSLVMDWQEGTTRGRNVRQGKIELDVRNTASDQLVINGRQSVNQPSTGKLDHYQFGWTRDPQVKISIDGNYDATILSILQEVTV